MAIRFGGSEESVSRIKVIGIGGGGNNTVDRMISAGLTGAEFIAINTDLQQLERSLAPVKLQTGEKVACGKGCGAMPEKGRKAAEESRAEIKALISDADLLFITAGMGGGTGTGGAPVVAEIAKELGILTVGVVTRPFKFEGARRRIQAEKGIAELHGVVDSLLVIPNERLKYVTDQKITLVNAFNLADDVLRQAIRSIYELITVNGLINLDFADIETVVSDGGFAHMGVGRAAGVGKALSAAKMAVQSPLLETSINGARGIIINITGGKDMELAEVEEAAGFVQDNVGEDATILFGAAIDPSLKDEMRITIIATGFESDDANPMEAEPQPVEATDALPFFSKKKSEDIEASEPSANADDWFDSDLLRQIFGK